MDLLYYIDTYMTHAVYPKAIIYYSIWYMSIAFSLNLEIDPTEIHFAIIFGIKITHLNAYFIIFRVFYVMQIIISTQGKNKFNAYSNLVINIIFYYFINSNLYYLKHI